MKSRCAAILLLLWAGPALRAAAETRPLLIAAEDWPPFEYAEEGSLKGINVEVIQRIMARLKVPVEFKFYPFARSWMLLENGKVDAIPSISCQPYREDILYFSEDQRAFLQTGEMPRDYLWVSEYVWFVNRRYAEAIHFESYEQMARDFYHIGVIRNYSYDQAFMDAKINRRMYSSARDALQDLARGDVDVVPMERTVGAWIVRGLGADDKITYIEKPLFSKPYYLAFSKKSDYPQIEQVWHAFDDELRKMRDSGEYASIYEQYIRPDYLSQITRPLVFVCEESAPYEFFDNGKLRGIDVDVTGCIMRRLGIPYEIKVYPWSRAWMMAEKGKADAVLSVSYKPSREETLCYTPEQRLFAETGAVPPDYLWTSEYVFFVMKQFADKYRFESYEQVKRDGLRVGRNKDYSYDEAFLAAQFEGSIFPGTKEGLLALVSGEIDLYPVDKTVGCAALAALGLEGSVTWLSRPLFSKPYLAPFCRKSDVPVLDDVMRAFNRELRLMRASGEYARICDGYLKAPPRQGGGE